VVLVADCGDGVEVGGHLDSALQVILAGHARPLWSDGRNSSARVRGVAVVELSTVGPLSTGEAFGVCFRLPAWLVFEHAF
jgi:hypothetical protein